MRKYPKESRKVLGKTKIVTNNGRVRFTYKRVDYILYWYKLLKPRYISKTFLMFSKPIKTPLQSMIEQGLVTINQ